MHIQVKGPIHVIYTICSSNYPSRSQFHKKNENYFNSKSPMDQHQKNCNRNLAGGDVTDILFLHEANVNDCQRTNSDQNLTHHHPSQRSLPNQEHENNDGNNTLWQVRLLISSARLGLEDDTLHKFRRYTETGTGTSCDDGFKSDTPNSQFMSSNNNLHKSQRNISRNYMQTSDLKRSYESNCCMTMWLLQAPCMLAFDLVNVTYQTLPTALKCYRHMLTRQTVPQHTSNLIPVVGTAQISATFQGPRAGRSNINKPTWISIDCVNFELDAPNLCKAIESICRHCSFMQRRQLDQSTREQKQLHFIGSDTEPSMSMDEAMASPLKVSTWLQRMFHSNFLYRTLLPFNLHVGYLSGQINNVGVGKCDDSFYLNMHIFVSEAVLIKPQQSIVQGVLCRVTKATIEAQGSKLTQHRILNLQSLVASFGAMAQATKNPFPSILVRSRFNCDQLCFHGDTNYLTTFNIHPRIREIFSVDSSRDERSACIANISKSRNVPASPDQVGPLLYSDAETSVVLPENWLQNFPGSFHSQQPSQILNKQGVAGSYPPDPGNNTNSNNIAATLSVSQTLAIACMQGLLQIDASGMLHDMTIILETSRSTTVSLIQETSQRSDVIAPPRIPSSLMDHEFLACYLRVTSASFEAAINSDVFPRRTQSNDIEKAWWGKYYPISIHSKIVPSSYESALFNGSSVRYALTKCLLRICKTPNSLATLRDGCDITPNISQQGSTESIVVSSTTNASNSSQPATMGLQKDIKLRFEQNQHQDCCVEDAAEKMAYQCKQKNQQHSLEVRQTECMTSNDQVQQKYIPIECLHSKDAKMARKIQLVQNNQVEKEENFLTRRLRHVNNNSNHTQAKDFDQLPKCSSLPTVLRLPGKLYVTSPLSGVDDLPDTVVRVQSLHLFLAKTSRSGWESPDCKASFHCHRLMLCLSPSLLQFFFHVHEIILYIGHGFRQSDRHVANKSSNVEFQSPIRKISSDKPNHLLPRTLPFIRTSPLGTIISAPDMMSRIGLEAELAIDCVILTIPSCKLVSWDSFVAPNFQSSTDCHTQGANTSAKKQNIDVDTNKQEPEEHQLDTVTLSNSSMFLFVVSDVGCMVGKIAAGPGSVQGSLGSCYLNSVILNPSPGQQHDFSKSPQHSHNFSTVSSTRISSDDVLQPGSHNPSAKNNTILFPSFKQDHSWKFSSLSTLWWYKHSDTDTDTDTSIPHSVRDVSTAKSRVETLVAIEHLLFAIKRDRLDDGTIHVQIRPSLERLDVLWTLNQHLSLFISSRYIIHISKLVSQGYARQKSNVDPPNGIKSQDGNTGKGFDETHSQAASCHKYKQPFLEKIAPVITLVATIPTCRVRAILTPRTEVDILLSNLKLDVTKSGCQAAVGSLHVNQIVLSSCGAEYVQVCKTTVHLLLTHDYCPLNAVTISLIAILCNINSQGIRQLKMKFCINPYPYASFSQN